MSAAQIVILAAGFLVLTAAMVAAMRKANETERRSMQRRHQEWIERGCEPDERPNFYAGDSGGVG